MEEEERMVKGESDRRQNWFDLIDLRKQDWADGQSLNGEQQCCVKVCFPADKCSLLPMRFDMFQNQNPFY